MAHTKSNSNVYKGVMPTVFKKIEPSDFKVNPFLAHKQFIFTSASANVDNYIVSYASYINNLPEISSSVPTTPNWPKNIDGSYHFSVYQSINQLYYKRKGEPFKVHGPSDLNRTKKHLYESASVFTIPQKKLGDGVKLETFTFSGSISYSSSNAGSVDHWSNGQIKSDRYSNLYNTLVNTGSFPGEEMFYEGFNEYHDVSNWKYTDFKLDNGTNLKGLTNSLTGSVPYTNRDTGPGHALHFLSSDYFSTPIDGYYNRNYDYAVSLFVKHPSGISQDQLIAGKLNTITDPKWPFAIQINSDDEIKFSAKGATNFEAIITSSVLDQDWHHVLCQKTGSSLELYIDGTKQSSGSFYLLATQFNTPFTASATINNTAPLKVAGYDGYNHGFLGSLDEIRIFNKSLTQAQITSLSDRNEHGGMMQTNHVGNIFPEQGIAVISFPYKAFNDLLSQPYTASYQSTVQLYEHSTLVRVGAGDFNVSQNPTTLQDDNINIEPWATGSVFQPYITEIGLYNDQGQMIAVGKLANPIKKRDDIDINFLVNIDIDM